MHKLISARIENRLKLVADALISEEHMGFTKERSCTDAKINYGKKKRASSGNSSRFL